MGFRENWGSWQGAVIIGSSPMTNNVAMVRNAIRDLGLRDWVPTPTYYLKRKWRKNSQR